MTEQLMRRWYVVMTHPHSETIASEHLRRQGFETYLPRVEKQRRHARKTDVVVRPLFPNYLFVAFDKTAQGWHCVRSTVGVSRLLGNEVEPLPVPDAVMKELRGRENKDGYVQLDERSRFHPGQPVEIVNGAFSSCGAIFDAISDKSRVAVLLNLMGRCVRVFLDQTSVATG